MVHLVGAGRGHSALDVQRWVRVGAFRSGTWVRWEWVGMGVHSMKLGALGRGLDGISSVYTFYVRLIVIIPSQIYPLTKRQA